MQLKSLKIRNFLSIESADVEFKDNGLWLLDGWNYDMERANGSGKSAICNAISFALYGKVPRRITASDILRHGTKNGSVEVNLESAGKTYRVIRERPNKLTFEVDGTVVPLTQEAFEAQIKFKYEQFIATMYFAQGSTGRFILLNDAEKKDFLIKLLNLDSFGKYKQAADEQVKQLNLQKKNLDALISTASTKILTYQEAIVDTAKIVSDIAILDKAIEKCHQEVAKLGLLNKPDQQAYKASEALLDAQLKDEIVASTKRPMLLMEHKKLAKQLEDLDKKPSTLSCPSCAADLASVSGRLVPADAPVDRTEEKNEVLAKMTSIKEAIDGLDKIIDASSSIKSQKQALYSANQDALSEWNGAQTKINSFKLQLSNFSNKRDSLQTKLDQQDSIKAKVQEQEAQLSVHKASLTELETKLELLNTVSSIFSATGAQAYVLDSTIDALNGYIKANIAEIWNNISYSLLTTKENSKGDVVAKFSEELLMNGEEKSLGSLSGGEFRALSIAIDLAIVDLLSNFLGVNISPIIFDEPFDGLDVVGKETVVELLQKMALNRQIFVIDHSSEIKAAFSDTIRVEKRAGISSIV